MVTSYGQFAYSGRIDSQSSFDNEPGAGWIVIDGTLDDGTPDCPAEGPLTDLQIVTRCSSTSNDGALNPVTIDTYYKMDWKTPQVHNLRANGVVECSSQGGGTTIQQSSSSMTGSSQDGDGDGIPNANDNCPNIPNTRCYKEGDTSIVVHSNR
jgi:Thrombospondin type 3 repeat